MSKGLIFIALLCFTTFTLCSNVVDLTPENFDQVIDGKKFAMVEFYAPWCGHCKRLAPEYEIVGNAFAKTNVVIAKVDADKHKDLANRFGVKGYPTIKFFAQSLEAQDYKGGRTATDIIKWINEKVPSTEHGEIPAAPPSFVKVLTPENFDRIVKDPSKHVFVEFYAPWCGHCKRLAPTWEKLGEIFNQDNDVVIAKLDADAHKDLAREYGVSGYPTIQFFPKDDKTGDKYNGGRELQNFLDFLGEKTGIVRNADGTLAGKIGVIDSITSLIKTYLTEKTEEASQAVLDAIEKLPKDQESYGKAYKKIFELIKSRENYISTEIARLERMLKGTMSKSKVDEFTVRKNILESLN